MNTSKPLGNNRSHGTFSAEHVFSVDPDNYYGGGQERERVIRLRVGPDRIVELKMEQRREQDATGRCVEQRGHDHADCNRASKKRSE
jgi:hypothetical protein